MKILVVSNTKLGDLPPLRNLIESLIKSGYEVVLISPGADAIRNSRVKSITINLVNRKSFFCVLDYFSHRARLRKLVTTEMKNCDFLWTATDKTVRELGKVVFRYKHIMQLQELIEDVPLFPGQEVFKCHIKKYALRAYKVVVPEFNRAQIQKAWWGLDDLPVVLPNKVDISNIEFSNENNEIIQELENEKRKIILYQGAIGKDRDLESFARAVSLMNDQYVFCVMGRVTDDGGLEELVRKYPNIKIIPYIDSPNHLRVTRKAYIGILPYKPEKVAHLSILNAVFCAPNKIFEFAAYGIPMIGTNVSGISIPFKQYKMGIIIDDDSTNGIKAAIEHIDDNYEAMSESCIRFYNDCDYDEMVRTVLK